MKRFPRASVLTVGAVLTISFAAMTQPEPGAFAQTPASPSPATAASPSPTPGQTMPRTGGFPMELAWPLVAGGAAAVGAGALLLRRGRR